MELGCFSMLLLCNLITNELRYVVQLRTVLLQLPWRADCSIGWLSHGVCQRLRKTRVRYKYSVSSSRLGLKYIGIWLFEQTSTRIAWAAAFDVSMLTAGALRPRADQRVLTDSSIPLERVQIDRRFFHSCLCVFHPKQRRAWFIRDNDESTLYQFTCSPVQLARHENLKGQPIFSDSRSFSLSFDSLRSEIFSFFTTYVRTITRNSPFISKYYLNETSVIEITYVREPTTFSSSNHS